MPTRVEEVRFKILRLRLGGAEDSSGNAVGGDCAAESDEGWLDAIEVVDEVRGPISKGRRGRGRRRGGLSADDMVWIVSS